jgi:hypothetical protein
LRRSGINADTIPTNGKQALCVKKGRDGYDGSALNSCMTLE